MLPRFFSQIFAAALWGMVGASLGTAQVLPPPPIERLPDPYVIEESPPAPDEPPVVEDPSVTPESAGLLWTPNDWFGSEPTWYNPISWFSPAFWDGTFEAGLNGSDGNNDVISLRAGFELSRETEYSNWDIDFTYGKNESDGVETQHNALLNSNWDYKLDSPRWSWFNKLALEYDEFKDFDIRVFGNTGLGYLLVDNDVTELRARFGAGGSREIGGVDEEWKPEAAFGTDFAHQLNPRQKLSVVIDYYPTWDNFDDYRIVADAGWEVVLDEASNLSLKLGLIDRYDSTPNGAQRNAVDYSMLFLWKL